MFDLELSHLSLPSTFVFVSVITRVRDFSCCLEIGSKRQVETEPADVHPCLPWVCI
jgi:hypothetical protein